MALTPDHKPADAETQLATPVTHSATDDVLDQTVSLPENESGAGLIDDRSLEVGARDASLGGAPRCLARRTGTDSADVRH